ncbi:hypothetical protein [Frateuria sp. YIM B11624]|uniref:hypothetical protein n=1 Tax=Frateuria sp. YIM B11624 TaxID=3143185 RepID=UPI003C779EC7
MRVFSLTTLAATLTFAAAAAAGPGVLPQNAQPSIDSTSPGTIILVRPLASTVNGHQQIIGSAIFSIHDDGSDLLQLTPYAEGVFNVPDAWPAPFDALENWVGSAFSPGGHYSQFLQAYTGSGSTSNNPYVSGKYYVMDASGQQRLPLFHDGNDLPSGNNSPSYGYLTWGPAGTHLIAFSNSANGAPVNHACVGVIHPDGTGERKLWCPQGYYPQYNQAVESLRWSGDGRSLLAYVELTTPDSPFPHGSDLYRVDVATGAATLVQANVTSNLHGPGGDLSYDGHEIVFQTNTPGSCTPDQQEQMVLCARNMLTGQQVALVDPSGALILAGGQLLLTPGGSQAIVNTIDRYSSTEELYVINTDGTGLRQLTQPCVPLDPNGNIVVTWAAVRLSPDGQQLLANCYVQQETPYVRLPTQMYVINLADGSARYVADGAAYDWHVPTP